MSTDSRYSPWASAIAVPPPNRQPFASSSGASSACRIAATLRWCGRSNKKPSSAQVLHERVDERQLGRLELAGLDVAPVAFVQAQRFLRAQRLHPVQLPGELGELGIVGEANAGRIGPLGRRLAATAPPRLDQLELEA